MAPKYVLMGGGGFALELYEYMNSEGKPPIGYYAPEEDHTLSQYLPWLGDEKTDTLDVSFQYILASGSIDVRKRIISFLEEHELGVKSFISRYAHVSSIARYGKGLVMTPYSVISGNPIVGDYVLLNGGFIGHDAFVGNNVVIGPSAHITGYCKIGDNSTFGANSALIPGTVVGSNSEIGILTFPRKRVKDHKTVISMPGVVIDCE